MLRLIRFLMYGTWHIHKWEDLRTVQVDNESGSSWTRYYCRCTECGVHKTFN